MRINAYEDQASSGVTTSINTTTVKSKIFKFVCPDRMTYTLLSGTPFVIKLADTGASNQMEQTARIFIGVKIPSQE
ncbi:unnamed protein product, partial [marine sediment metagenome]